MKTDKDIYADLGKRIRASRKKLGLTQAQLCGDFMTRNMLSRIETGDAHPSMETLLFISAKLKTPPAYFLCRDSKEEAEYTKAILIKDARRAFGMGQYKKCIEICSSLPSDDDEISSMTAMSRIMSAIALFDRENLEGASSQLDLAWDSIHSTVYLFSEMQAQIKLLRLMIYALSKGIPPKPSELPSSAPMFFSKDRFLYTVALSMIYHEDRGAVFLKNALGEGAFKSHLEAIELIDSQRHEEALPILENALNNAPDCYSGYFILVDLEKAYRLCDDFKSAYALAEKRMLLKEKYSVVL